MGHIIRTPFPETPKPVVLVHVTENSSSAHTRQRGSVQMRTGAPSCAASPKDGAISKFIHPHASVIQTGAFNELSFNLEALCVSISFTRIISAFIFYRICDRKG